MQPVLPVFLDRVAELADLRQGVKARRWRCALVWARFGMGKTSLLGKFRGDFSDPAISVYYYDLLAEQRKPDILLIISDMLGKLGPEQLPGLFQTLQAAQRSQSTESRSTAPRVNPLRRALRALLQPLHSRASTVSEAGPAQYTFEGHVDARNANFISANQVTVNVYQINKNSPDIPKPENDQNLAEFTLALQKDLHKLCKQQPLLLLFDHWEAAHTTVQKWLTNHLFNWVLDKLDLNIQLIAASETLPEWYSQGDKIKLLEIGQLPLEETRHYWLSLGFHAEQFSSLLTTPVLLQGAVSEAQARRSHDG